MRSAMETVHKNSGIVSLGKMSSKQFKSCYRSKPLSGLHERTELLEFESYCEDS